MSLYRKQMHKKRNVYNERGCDRKETEVIINNYQLVIDYNVMEFLWSIYTYNMHVYDPEEDQNGIYDLIFWTSVES